MDPPRLISVALLVLAGLSPALTAADGPVIPTPRCPAGQRLETIVLTLSPRVVAVPRNPGLHWVVDPMPTEADIQISDPALKSAIEQWIQDESSRTHPWVLDGRSEWTFVNGGLARGVAAVFTINPFPVIAAPPAGATAIRKPLAFCAAPVQNLVFGGLEIQVVSAGRDPGTPAPAAKTLSANLPSGVTAVAYLTGDEFEAREPATLLAYARVAEVAWQTAARNGITLGGTPGEQTMRQAESAIARIYSTKQGNLPFEFWGRWPQPHVVFQHARDGRCCTLLIEGLQMADHALLKVEPNLPAPAGDDTGGHNRAIQLARRTQEVLRERFRTALDAFKEAVPTFDQINELRRNLSAAREIYPATRLMVAPENPRVIVFDADNRWTILGVKLTAGAGYSVEDKFMGKAEFQGENLLVQVPDQLDPRETATLSYAGGNQVQKLNAAWGLTWTRNHASGAESSYGPGITGNYLQDLDQRFGNLTGPALRDRERGVDPGFNYSFTPSPVNAKGEPARHLLGTVARIGLPYRHFNVDPADGSGPPPLANGSVTALLFDATEGYSYVPGGSAGPGLGGVDVRLRGRFLRGFPVSDFTFTQTLLSLEGTVYFGFHQPRDFFVRARKGIGGSTGRTPLFELFRLGGTDSVRGIEQGESVGRKLAFEQYEAGIAAAAIGSWFKRPEATGPVPFDLSKFYIKGFYDRGRVVDAAGFGDLFALRHTAKGYGLAGELQGLPAGNKRITLTIGYAYSPDSVLHRRGTVITAAALDF